MKGSMFLRKMLDLKEPKKILTKRIRDSNFFSFIFFVSSASFASSASSASSSSATSTSPSSTDGRNFEYCSLDMIYKHQNASIREKREMNRNKEKGAALFSCNNEEFFEQIQQFFKKEKHNLNMWHKYCRELMYRINETHISPHIITKVFCFLSYTDYKNDRLLSEMLNRCILRLHEFDLITICSIVNALGNMDYKHMYFLDEVKKRLFNIEEVEYSEKKDVCHYISLLVNSLIKQNYLDIDLLKFLIEKIHKHKVEQCSLLGLSLLLYNISKMKLESYYDMFKKCEKYIIQKNKEFGIIQIMNILNAYDKTNRLTSPLLLSMLYCIEEKIICVPLQLCHLLKPLKISLSFVTKNQTDKHCPNEHIEKVLSICLHILNEICKNIHKGEKKEIVTFCSILSKYKKLLQNEKGMYNVTILKDDILLILFQKMSFRIKRYVTVLNHIEASVVLHSYSLYKMFDLVLFDKIKLRSLRIFSTFSEKSFSYLFQAFTNFNFQDKMFQKCCLNEMLKMKKVNSFQNFCMLLSALYKIELEPEERKKVFDFITKNAKHFLINNSCGKYNDREIDLFKKKLNQMDLKDTDITQNDVYEENIKVNLKGEDVSSLALLLSKMNNMDVSNMMELLISNFKKHKKEMRVEHTISFLVSLSNLAKNIKTEKSKIFWKHYYDCINELVEITLQDEKFYNSKSNIINFLNCCAKIFHPYAVSFTVEHDETLTNNNKEKEHTKQPFYLKNVIEYILESLFCYINEMHSGEIGIVMESLSRENFSVESINTILKNKGELFFTILINRCYFLLHKQDDNKDNKNILIIANNLIKMDCFDKKLIDLIIKKYVFTAACLNSIFSISHVIYFLCTYVFMKEHICSTRKIRLFDFLLKKLHDLLINEHIIFYKNKRLFIDAEETELFSKNVMFYKSMKCLHESFLIISCLSLTNTISDFILNRKLLEKEKQTDLEGTESRKNKNVNSRGSNSVTLGLLNTLFHLRLFFCVMIIGEKIKTDYKKRAIDKMNISETNYIMQNINEMKIKNGKISVGFWDILKIEA